MASEGKSKDFVHERQIDNANCLANALLSGLIAEGITENKRNIKISANLKNLHELFNKYKNEIDKLRSLRIGSCSDVLEEKEDRSFEVQIVVAEKLLKKIYDILQAHVKHDVSQVVTKEDIATIKDHMSLLTEMQVQLKQAPESQEDLKRHLATTNEIEDKLDKIIKSIDKTSKQVNDLQQDVITKSSDVLYLST